MAYRVQPTEPRKQFPLVLRDLNGTELGLILCDRKGNLLDTAIGQAASPSSVMRISQGAPGYSDFELPYTPILQDSWTGGRGAKNFETGTTRYAESEGVDTSNGDIVLGPAPFELLNNVPWASNYTAGTAESELTPYKYTLSRFVVASAQIIRSVKINLNSQVGETDFRVMIYGETASLPGTLLAASKYIPAQGGAGRVEISVPISLSVTAGQVIYIGFERSSYPLTTLVTRDGTGVGSVWGSGDGTTWSVIATNRVLKIKYSSDGPGRQRFFKYHGVTYQVKTYDDGTGVRLFRNGYHGFAQAGSTINSIVTTWNTTGLCKGRTLRILAGKGARQEYPLRPIYHQVTNLVELRNNEFDVAPDTTSEIAIDGLGYPNNTIGLYPDELSAWVEITGHGLTGVVAQPLVINDFVYFPQGSSVNLRKMRMNGSTLEFADDSTNKADFIIACPKTTGGYQVWVAIVSQNLIYKGDAVTDWASTLPLLVANGGKTVSVSGAKITGLIPYGEPTMPFVMKEDGFGSINNDVYSDMPINNMIEKMRSLMTGRAVAVSDVYLFFSMANGKVERYYDRHLDDVGPDRDEGLPANQQGEVSDILTLPGRILVSIDAGEAGYSSIFMNNGQGWHEYYRAPMGRRVRGIAFQELEGEIDRILVSQDDKTIALHYSIQPEKVPALGATTYNYNPIGWIRSARISGSMRDVRKFWKSLTLFSERLYNVNPSTDSYIEVQYRTDEDPNTWKNAVEQIRESMIDKTDLSVGNDVSGRWFEFKLILHAYGAITGAAPNTPVVDAVLLDTITRTPPKDAWTLYFLMGDQLRDQQDDLITLDAQDYQTQLNNWADSRLTPWPLRMYSMIPAFNDKLVMIEPPSISPIEVTVIGDSGEKTVVHKMLGQMRVMAV